MSANTQPITPQDVDMQQFRHKRNIKYMKEWFVIIIYFYIRLV